MAGVGGDALVTHLLYAYKATEDDGEELRYSLRSVEKNLHMGPLLVTVVGDRPSWWRYNFIPGNPTDDKATNMLWNIAEATKSLWEDGVDEVIYLSDDYLLMFPQEDIIPITYGDLADHIAEFRRFKGPDDWYRIAIERTQELLHHAGTLEPLSFERHLPMPLDTAKASKILAPFSTREGPKPFWRTMYGNLAGFDRPVRKSQDGLYYGQSPVRIGTPWVSAIPSAWEAHMRRRAHRMFPRPSRWE